MALQKADARISHLIFIYAYVIVICKAMVACYRINDCNYLHISLLYIIGILLSKLYFLIAPAISKRPVAILIPLSLLLVLAAHNYEVWKPLWKALIVQNFESINLGIYNGTETHYRQFLPFLILLVPVTAGVCHALSSRGKTELTILILSMYMFSFWNNGLDKLLPPYLPAFIIISVLYYSVGIYHHTAISFRNSDTKVTVNFRNILLYSVVLSLLVTLSSSAAAHVFGSKSLLQIKNNYELRERRLASSSKKAAFDLTGSIYGRNTGKLGGPIRLNTLIALKVKAERPLYLRGTVRDYYDGSSWSKSFDDYAVKGLGSIIEPSRDFNLLMTGSPTNKPAAEKMSIQHYGLATSTLFAPGNTENISIKSGKILYDSSGTFLLMGKDTVSGSYSLKYYYSNTGAENISSMNGATHGISYESSSDNLPQSYKPYLQVPDTVTQRTYVLVDEITENCSTTEEKLDSILNYLSSNFPYTLEVSQVPEGVDFLDHFLFSEKKGYCTYFATASTIMCRLAGIPARYVEGFNMDGEKDSAGHYIVRNHRAHAWTEVLLSPESNLWSIADCVPQGTAIEQIYTEGGYRDKFDDDRYKIGRENLFDIDIEGYFDSIRDYSPLLSILFYPMFAISAAAVLLLLLYIIFRLAASNRRTSKCLSEKSMIPFYRHIISRLSTVGGGIPEECCELEYVRSLKDRELAELLESIVAACYSEYYGGGADIHAIDKKSCNRSIEKYLRKKSGFIRYWYCRIRYC